MEQVHLGESTAGECHDQLVTLWGLQIARKVRYLSPNNMPVSCYEVQDLQQVLSAMANGIEQGIRLELLKRTWKSSIWSKEDDEEMTLPDPEIPVAYSLRYV